MANIWRRQQARVTKRYPRSSGLSSGMFYKQRPGQNTNVIANTFFEATTTTYAGILKRWTGSAWVKEPLKRYNGSSWVTAVLKVYKNSTFGLVDTTGV
jgi:hypothetical protein